ncbi:efflux RND transporter periplasmic adaptor subunit [Entomobacter blattae]|uniref:Multidrug resistance protein MdtA n=1 Tax=Entomobacter blattae TaxID=2762277 RepID=A0A7H1NT75_9PROT|nr:efflux RND transporter periplasmic adaptor subunit [Entomobacter blattae]QNT78985.1 Multidrug resistance protein MdtA [Entomobacter blattae]
MTASRKSSKVIGFGVVLLALIIAGLGILYRKHEMNSLRRETLKSAIVKVAVISPQPAPPRRVLDLPGNIVPWYQATIFARVPGYVKAWYKDYGARVKKGDVLAVLNTPDLDAQYAAAKADARVKQAQYDLATLRAKRWKALEGTEAVAKMQVDVYIAEARAAQATLEAAQREVQKFEALEAFKTIVAPFDGAVISREINLGDFVGQTGGNMEAQGGSSELFTVADIEKVRIFVSVPQDFAYILTPDLVGDLYLPQYKDRVFKAKYLTTAGAFDPATRTAVTELEIDNKDHFLWPGSYAHVHFDVPNVKGVLVIPETTLIFRSAGTQVALLTKGNKVHLQNVRLGDNTGVNVEILSGIQEKDMIINNPPADIQEGEEVNVVPLTPGYNAPVVSHTSEQKHHH